MKITEGLQKFNRGNETYYALGGNLYTEEELVAMDAERQKKDEQKGYEDRNAHCYDKVIYSGHLTIGIYDFDRHTFVD